VTKQSFTSVEENLISLSGTQIGILFTFNHLASNELENQNTLPLTEMMLETSVLYAEPQQTRTIKNISYSMEDCAYYKFRRHW
jgi:hypothetical protein